MIWLFRVDEVFWDNKPRVNEFYQFDVDDIHFDITQYDISLYFGSADYYLRSKEDDIYLLRSESIYKNPIRIKITKDTEIYNIIKEFYVNKISDFREDNINELIN